MFLREVVGDRTPLSVDGMVVRNKNATSVMLFFFLPYSVPGSHRCSEDRRGGDIE